MDEANEPTGLLAGIQARFRDRADFSAPCFTEGDLTYCVVFLSGLIDLHMLQNQLYEPLRHLPHDISAAEAACVLNRRSSPLHTPYRDIEDEAEAVVALLQGETLLLLEGVPDRAWAFPFSDPVRRAIEQPGNEKGNRGPQEAFVEDLDTNLSLIRARIRSSDLKIVAYQKGKHTKTRVLLLYMQGLSDEAVVATIQGKLEAVHGDAVLGSSYIEECLDRSYSPFPQFLYTERPDVVASSLLEGRVAVLVQGTPNPIIAPVSFFTFLQAADDYYQRFFFSTWIRWLRLFFMIVSLLLPSTYVAITTFHPEMIPSNLLVTVASSRDVVPFPAIVEAFAMELTFEVLREAGQRIPNVIGQTVSIAGALVIGQAAVQAGIVSAPMVIIVALTGISSFLVPHYELGLAFRFLRFALLIPAAVFGLIGVMIGLFLIYIHLLSLRSLGAPYLKPLVGGTWTQFFDVFARAPWPWLMKHKKPAGGRQPNK